MKVNMGCGDRILDGYVNVDKLKLPGVDMVMDIEKGIKLRDGSVDEMLLFNLLEHTREPLKVLEEIHRVLKVGGSVRIMVPHCRSSEAFTDMTHKSFFTKDSFNCLVPGHRFNYYTKARFRIPKNKVVYGRLPRKLPFKFILGRFLNNVAAYIDITLVKV